MTLLCVLLPIGFFFLALRYYLERSGWADAFFLAVLTWGCALVGGTELLNQLRAITPRGAILLWAGLDLAFLIWNFLQCKRSLAARFHSLANGLAGLPFTGRVTLAALLLLLTFELVLSGVAPPSNGDCLDYHLARVAFWIQNRSIDFYATNYISQNHLPPFAEWAVLHLVLVQGTDQFCNLIQGFAHVGCALLCASLVLGGGGDAMAALVAAFFAATLPQAIFEGLTAQTDLVMSFWMLGVVYATQRLSAVPDRSRAVAFGICLGLAVLTKTLAFIYAFPFVILAAWIYLRRGDVAGVILLGLPAVLLNLGHAWRNWASSGSPLGPASRYLNEVYTPAALLLDVVRNLSLHTNYLFTKKILSVGVFGLHRWLGFDPNDPRFTFEGMTFDLPSQNTEDHCVMSFSLALFVVVLGIVLWKGRLAPFQVRMLAGIMVGLALTFAILLKWQPFHSRLQLFLFLGMAPVVAWASSIEPWRKYRPILFVILLFNAMPELVDNHHNRVFGPRSVFTAPRQVLNQRDWLPDYDTKVLPFLQDHQVRQLGLVTDERGQTVYDLFTGGSRRPVPPFRIDYVNVTTLYAPLETKEVPDALLVLNDGAPEQMSCQDHIYVKAIEANRLAVYLPK